MRIKRINQRNLLLPPPALELFFAVDGVAHIIEGLPIKQAIHIVFTGETIENVPFVLEYARFGAAN